jgi:hypothetical protein
MENIAGAILTHFLTSLKLTAAQIFILIGPGLILACIMNLIAKNVALSAARVMGPRAYLGAFGWLGTSVHELGHAVFCLVFMHKITDMKLFDPDPATGTLGYVSHSYNRKSFYQNAGNFFIGIGPILLGTVVIYGAARFLISETFFLPFRNLAISAESFQSMNSMQTLLINIYESFKTLMLNLFTVENLKRWQFYVFVYILFCVGSSITLSRPDIEGSAMGFGVFFGVLLLVNIAALFFGGLAMRYFVQVTQYYSVFYAVMVFAILMNGLLLVPLVLMRGGRIVKKSL